MTETPIVASLRIITDLYGPEVADYVRRVTRAEAKSTDLEPEEVISIAFIVLERTKQKYDVSRGQFTNYAIRSLKNELIRTKRRDFYLYDDNGSESITGTVSTTDTAFGVPPEHGETFTEMEFERQSREAMYITMGAVLTNDLTPLEKSMLYLSFYSTELPRSVSFKNIASLTGVPHQSILSSYRAGMHKLKQSFGPGQKC